MNTLKKVNKNFIFKLIKLLYIIGIVGAITEQAIANENYSQKDSHACPIEPVTQPTTSKSLSLQLNPTHQLKIIGATVINENDLRQALQLYQDVNLTTEWRQLVDAITQLYIDKGYINSRAILVTPQQDKNVLEIRIIEGSLELIEIQGIKRINPSYICKRIKFGAGKVFNTGNLEDQLRLMRLDPLFDNIEASLRPSGKVGRSVLAVRVQEANLFTSTFNVDNYSPQSVGSERLGVALSHRNLTGNGDELAAAYFRSTTGGSEAFEFNYQVPINVMNGKMQIRYAPNRNQITQAPFNQLGIRGRQDVYEINYRQPLKRTPREEFALSLGFSHQSGQTFIFDNLATPFGIGPDQNGISRTSVIKFSQDYVKRDPKGAWAVNSQLNFGTGFLNATVNSAPIPDAHFFSWFFQLQRAQQLNTNHLLIVQTDLQLTPDSLLPSQQFVIGGGQSIRGYRQNARSGDNGFRLAVEDRITVHRDESGSATIQLAPFIDLGAVWNHPDNPNKLNNQTFLASTGLGLIWNNAMGIRNLNLRIDYAMPFIDLKDKANNAQDEGFYFNLRYQP